MTKKFNKKDLNIMQNIVGLKLTDLFYQPTKIILEDNTFVFKFGTKAKYALNVCCFVRIKMNGKIILTSSDEYFTPSYTQLDYNIYEDQDYYEKSLFTKTIPAAEKILIDFIVKRVELNETADILITLDNDATIDIIPDCLYQNYEYYRFFNVKKGSPHHIISFEDGEIVLKTNELIT